MTDKIPGYIPFTEKEEAEAAKEAVEKRWISPAGSEVEDFEEKFSEKLDSQYTTAVDSGTAALHLAVEALELSEDAEIIAPSFTYGATGLAATASRKNLKLVDVEEETMGINPEKFKKTITEDTEAVIVTHMFGKVCQIEEIRDIAEKNDLYIIEDAAQALNAERNGIKAGNFGDIGCFSFAWSKNLTTGKGGMITTNNLELAEKIQKKSDYGRETGRYSFTDKIAYNYDMDNIRASIGLEQLKKLEEIEKRKREIFQHYSSELEDIEELEIRELDKNDVPTVYSIFLEDRDQLRQHLKERNIGTRKLYKPLHRTPAFKDKDDFPVSEKLADTGLGLPSHPSLNRESIDRVIQEIENYFS